MDFETLRKIPFSTWTDHNYRINAHSSKTNGRLNDSLDHDRVKNRGTIHYAKTCEIITYLRNDNIFLNGKNLNK